MLAGPPPTALFVLALLLSGATLTQAAEFSAEDPEPPTVRWVKGHNILDITVIPQGQTHLAPDQTIRLSLDDGAYFRIRWAEPDVPEVGRMRLRLPRVAARKSSGWLLVVQGVVCTESQTCIPFRGQATVPKGPRLSGRFPAALVPLEPPELAPPEPPSPKLAPPKPPSPPQAN